MPLHEAVWNQTEEFYLTTVTDEQKEAYSRMTRKGKGATLIEFMKARPSEPGAKGWRKSLLASLSASAAKGGTEPAPKRTA